jgi:drug/metabolite transporter (DMT)-like permease
MEYRHCGYDSRQNPPMNIDPDRASRLRRPAAYAALASSMTLVGSYVALSKPLAQTFPIFLLAWLRFGIAALAMHSWVRRRADEPPIAWRTHAALFGESLFGNFLFTVFMVWGVGRSGAIAAAIVMASIPAWVALLSAAFLSERVTQREWIAVALAVMGIALLGLGQHTTAQGVAADTAAIDPLGLAALLAAALCEAIYSVIGKRLTGSLGAKRITAIINLWGLALATPLGAFAAWHFRFDRVGPGQWGLLVFYAFAASVWSVWLWMTGLKTVPASRAGVFTVMMPLSATLVGVLVLGEPFKPLQGAALALACLAVILATQPTSDAGKAKATPTPPQ